MRRSAKPELVNAEEEARPAGHERLHRGQFAFACILFDRVSPHHKQACDRSIVSGEAVLIRTGESARAARGHELT